jgi:hypothetical protein
MKHSIGASPVTISESGDGEFEMFTSLGADGRWAWAASRRWAPVLCPGPADAVSEATLAERRAPAAPFSLHSRAPSATWRRARSLARSPARRCSSARRGSDARPALLGGARVGEAARPVLLGERRPSHTPHAARRTPLVDGRRAGGRNEKRSAAAVE